MIEKHYGKYIGTEGDAPLREMLAGKSAISGANFSRQDERVVINKGNQWRPRRDLNPIRKRKPKARKANKYLRNLESWAIRQRGLDP